MISASTLGIGVWVLLDPFGPVGRFLKRNLPVLFISLGLTVALLGFLGCYASVDTNSQRIKTYWLALACLVLGNAIILALGFYYESIRMGRTSVCS